MFKGHKKGYIIIEIILIDIVILANRTSGQKIINLLGGRIVGDEKLV
jgi:hypothetical protein